jgi:hypothetical protein
MRNSWHRGLVVVGMLIATCGLVVVDAQPDAVVLQMSGTLAGARATFSGRGECHQSDAASIYEVPAAMWHASFSGGTGIDRLNVTLWQPKAGGPMQITLAADAGRNHYSIGTVKGGTLSGSGTARVDRQGAGGTLVIQGQTASGAAIQLSVSCSRFTAPEDNG